MCNVPNENLISKCLWFNSYICKLIHEEHKVRVNVNLKINFIDCFTFFLLTVQTERTGQHLWFLSQGIHHLSKTAKLHMCYNICDSLCSSILYTVTFIGV